MNTSWGSHPKLKGKFHEDFPNDLQVILHEGGPRITNKQPELIWVSIKRALDPNLFEGTVLNTPQNLRHFKEGDLVQFIVPSSGDYPITTTTKYLAERNNWIIEACDQCQFNELFDAPSDLINVIFPNVEKEASIEGFSTFCGCCGGTQLVKNKNINTSAKRWKFWK